MPQIDVEKLYRVSWLDPAGGRRGKHNSRAAIATIGMDDYERVFILQCWAAYCGTSVLIDRVFRDNARWRPTVFGIDASGQQIHLCDMIRQEAARRGEKLPLKPIVLHMDKIFAIEHSIQPLLAQGRLFRPEEKEVVDLKNEWVGFPDRANYNDCLDALACAIRLLPMTMPEVHKQMATDQLKRYYQKMGKSAEEIERIVASR